MVTVQKQAFIGPERAKWDRLYSNEEGKRAAKWDNDT